MSENTVVLVFNGHRHKLTTVLAVGKNGPTIPVDFKDINDFENFVEVEPNKVNQEHVVTFHNQTGDEDQEVMFFKQHGKYTVLLGRKKVIAAGKEAADNLAKRNAALEELDGSTDNKAILQEEYKKIMAKYPDKPVIIKGKLISTPALKSTRIIEPSQQVVHAPVIPTPANYPSNFANRPRFNDTNYSRERFGK